MKTGKFLDRTIWVNGPNSDNPSQPYQVQGMTSDYITNHLIVYYQTDVHNKPDTTVVAVRASPVHSFHLCSVYSVSLMS
jgi:hypothetical protein